jgi:hypothetical protein
LFVYFFIFISNKPISLKEKGAPKYTKSIQKK